MLHLIKTTHNTQVKHSKLYSVLHAKQQNAQYHNNYTAQQHARVAALARALQAQYPGKRIYVNARATTLSASVSNTTQVCSNLLLIAKQFDARVKLTQTAIILHTV